MDAENSKSENMEFSLCTFSNCPLVQAYSALYNIKRIKQFEDNFSFEKKVDFVALVLPCNATMYLTWQGYARNTF